MNRSLLRSLVDWYNLLAFVPNKLIVRLSGALQNSTDGPFGGTKYIHITGRCGTALILETASQRPGWRREK
jgi:hypothetical protein